MGVERDRPLVVAHPGCSMPARTYPWEMFTDAITLLVRELGANVMVTGSADESLLVAWICRRAPNDVRPSVYPLAGPLSFAKLCALIEIADLTITNNTGPMHISAAVKTPVVALFALTNPPEQWGPWHAPHRQLYHDVSCRICYSRVCPYGHECLRLVSPEMVIEAARELMVESGRLGPKGPASRVAALKRPRRKPIDAEAALGDPAIGSLSQCAPTFEGCEPGEEAAHGA